MQDMIRIVDYRSKKSLVRLYLTYLNGRVDQVNVETAFSLLQLLLHVMHYSLLPIIQSSFCCILSTETAILKVYNDIILELKLA